MDVTVKAVLGTELYYTEVTAGSNVLITDEPADLGGQNKGFNPFEVLATSLASCTAATLRMYMDRKKWEAEKIVVEIEMTRDTTGTKTTFNRKVSFEGASLDADMKKRLAIIADKCPVHKVLTGEVTINTELAV
ncbi:OsmC family protein [Myroides odoratimimus]|uniref:Osmotically inducible protein OsmC n=1 Tax=Myroides odoratimimus TaxID=76832 RepID=A0AAI8G697_9FLAO|nr:MULTISPECIES: OsmC family protein [Myroides]AJA70741.1 putative redox protein, regulator of disulfide bond formation [Myroides sp. A21]ALU27676.1 osmotically inducible protein OsmC [Myroides odoratimimus]EHO07421.1 hypothetical protein HMPREF9714_02501 [Myroides odoratimimus CCUG 12901]EPH13799.1 hypothetical protein HMPREF9713_00371 [Myroides odoratimimus CCUG 12700]MDM1035128.1 OsmC family protein [Myroides odoratimimus]